MDRREFVERDRVGQTIADSYRRQPQSPEEDAMANAVAMVEAEPWQLRANCG